MSIPSATITGVPPLEIPHDVLVEQKQGQAIMIWTIGAFCIFGWELILCLPREYCADESVLPLDAARLQFSSALYLANRYFGLAKFTFAVTLFSGAWTPATCKQIFYFQPVGGLISTIISQMILGGRVYAIFSQHKVIGLSLLGMLMAEAVVCGIAISKIFLPPPVSGGPASSQPACGVLMGPFGWLVTFWTMPLLFDTVTFLLTAWRAYGLWKTQMNVGSHGIFDIIWRDGLLYFFAIFSMNTVNVVVFLTTPRALRAVNLPATLVLQVVLSCRLVLNLRESHTRSSLSSGQTRTPKWSDSNGIKLRSVALASHGASTSSGEKRIEVHSLLHKAAPSPTDTPEIGSSSSDKNSNPLQETDTWSAA
ncbi:hypothetical protein CVT25_004460 [Psilocybe cyanescens]|uniref:Uncharacterized protein n=1 Tax=Psilocybe cyanescens TaxID=93625 RepID=A0A409X2H1_PSICY|nr:hypothetical protein CVT25_004460 [Psilocybe cyanescens]